MESTRSPYEIIRRIVTKRSAIVLDPSKDYLLDARLAPILDREGLRSLDELAGVLEAERCTALLESVVEAMTTNETSFFRDPAVFRALREDVFPALLARRSTEQRLRIWCAASSSGQEPYSVAMLLDDAFPALASWDVQILATDLNAAMVARTEAAKFSEHGMKRGLPPGYAERYFEREDDVFRIVPRLRSRVRTRRLNLIETWPAMPRFDLVLLRNVLIYFDVATRRQIVERIPSVLGSDGLLLLGGQETLLGVTDALENVSLNGATAYRHQASAE